MLEKINGPADLKKLTNQKLLDLAKEVRARIIEVTSKNGGHIAPSLGATDLAISLIKTFDLEKDKVIWDVGHQSYAYKILTGRNKEFETLRQYKGLGGFNNPEESKYDAFRVGHTSTSISAAVGMAIAEKQNKRNAKVIAIIGDGAMTGGMAFEALNHAGDLQLDNLIVILNDNKMSISKNVGALQKHLTTLLSSRRYNNIKRQIWNKSKKLPNNLRRKFIHGAKKLEESMMNILVPNIIFEDLGFHYIGPIDGHDIPRMNKILHKTRDHVNGPVFIHAYTKKGKGYEFAESDAASYHGVSPFKKSTGESIKKKKISFSKVFGNKLVELAKNNEKIYAISAAMMQGTGLINFCKKYTNRMIDVGIAEQHAVTLSAGLAKQGMKPFVAIYSTFLQRAYDQIIHDVALQNLPVVFCLDRAGLVGADGPTHHGVFDISYLNLIPNLKIMAPASKSEFEAMIEFAAAYYDGPLAIRYPRGTIPEIDETFDKIEIGKWATVKNSGNIALLGIGKGYEWAREINKKLSEENIDNRLINARFAKPLDLKLLQKLGEDGVEKIFTFEDNALKGGFGSQIKDYLCNSKLEVRNFGIPDKFITHGDTNKLFDEIGLTIDKLTKKIKTITNE